MQSVWVSCAQKYNLQSILLENSWLSVWYLSIRLVPASLALILHKECKWVLEYRSWPRRILEWEMVPYVILKNMASGFLKRWNSGGGGGWVSSYGDMAPFCKAWELTKWFRWPIDQCFGSIVSTHIRLCACMNHVVMKGRYSLLILFSQHHEFIILSVWMSNGETERLERVTLERSKKERRSNGGIIFYSTRTTTAILLQCL